MNLNSDDKHKMNGCSIIIINKSYIFLWFIQQKLTVRT